MMAQKKKINQDETIENIEELESAETVEKKTAKVKKVSVEPSTKSTITDEVASIEGKIEADLAQPSRTRDDRSVIFLGGGLLLLGLLLLVGRLLSIPFGEYLWPFIFIVPGVLLFMTSLSSESGSAEGLSIFGGILTSLGLLFLAQVITGLWATWAYAWALVAPTSIGLSQMIFGQHKGRDNIYQSGLRVAKVGLWILLAGFIFFELIIGVSGFGLSKFGLPVIPMVLIFAGVLILVRSLIKPK